MLPTSHNLFVAYVDAVGNLDGKRCLPEWKTTSIRYPEDPDGLLAIGPQLIYYSWISGISEAAAVAFVRKRIPEIQYLKTTISDEQRREYGHLAVWFLASRYADYIMGRVLYVNGGFKME